MSSTDLFVFLVILSLQNKDSIQLIYKKVTLYQLQNIESQKKYKSD